MSLGLLLIYGLWVKAKLVSSDIGDSTFVKNKKGNQ